MTVRMILLISLVASIAFCQSNLEKVDKKGNITLWKDLVLDFGPWNLEANATINITHSVPVVVCVGLAEFGLPNGTQYAPEQCAWFQNYTADKLTVSTFNVPALNFNYSVGVFFAAKDITKDNVTEIEIAVEGTVCNTGEYYDSETQKCTEVAHDFTHFNGTFNMQYPPRGVAFFTWVAPERVKNAIFKLEDHSLIPDASNFVVYARYNGVADQNFPQYVDDSNGTLTIPAPLPGLWVVSVQNKNAQQTLDATLSFQSTQCPGANEAGVDCLAVPLATNNVTLVITATTGSIPTYYYRFTANKETRLLVSVTTLNHTQLPMLYASRGQLPLTDGSNANIVNCNRDYCGTVRSISYNVTAGAMSLEGEEEWYITVHTSLTQGNTTIGIWFNTSCVPGCTTNNRGQCMPDGTCDCLLDFEGIDCAHSDGLGAPYIVLIIIASLVVASAVVGFVAWAYMRRKRDNYETLA